MSQPINRSLCIALGRIHNVILTSCGVIALSLVAQVVVWSLCTFTELRFADPEAVGEAPLVVQQAENRDSSVRGRDANQKPVRRFMKPIETDEQDVPMSAVESIFKIIVTVARTLALMSALVILPVLCLGVLMAALVGAPRVDEAVNALILVIVLVLLLIPLGGWFGMAWQQGAITDYTGLTTAVDAWRSGEVGPAFFSRFLLLPTASAIGFIYVCVLFNSAVRAVLPRRDGLDPELEREASNVAATSLHPAGRNATALGTTLEPDKKKKKRGR